METIEIEREREKKKYRSKEMFTSLKLQVAQTLISWQLLAKDKMTLQLLSKYSVSIETVNFIIFQLNPIL